MNNLSTQIATTREIWKPVKGYEGLYEVSNLGRLKSFYNGTNHIMNPSKSLGYRHALLYKNGKRKNVRMNRIVAEAFLQNSNNYPFVNHKNEIKSDDRACNLEWCTISYNNNYGTKLRRSSISQPKRQPVCQYDLNGIKIKEFESAASAEKELNLNHCTLIQCCNLKRLSHKGFLWCYKKYENRINEVVLKSKQSNNFRMVAMYDLNMNFIKSFESINKASIEMKTTNRTIAKSINGIRNNKHKYIWKEI